MSGLGTSFNLSYAFAAKVILGLRHGGALQERRNLDASASKIAAAGSGSLIDPALCAAGGSGKDPSWIQFAPDRMGLGRKWKSGPLPNKLDQRCLLRRSLARTQDGLTAFSVIQCQCLPHLFADVVGP